MLTQQGIALSSLVDLDASCSLRPELHDDELHLEFGSRTGSLSLAVTEQMVDRLLTIFAEAKAHFGHTTPPPGSTHGASACPHEAEAP
ncbi:hypothetical protein [Pseudonocardia sp. HH130630-07]|uniref:hypothetical protein n=1 Tax=Pseudonocardia sp. HH130630-07 TaxID=1690815 RepID=UPI0008150621|nr:hypothetical protein [Pseudonocardia sp. HH130630-07]ANY07555.1 hypothetical protein AFB00_16060 [Pseudonocardia sp. HH130630-07]